MSDAKKLTEIINSLEQESKTLQDSNNIYRELNLMKSSIEQTYKNLSHQKDQINSLLNVLDSSIIKIKDITVQEENILLGITDLDKKVKENLENINNVLCKNNQEILQLINNRNDSIEQKLSLGIESITSTNRKMFVDFDSYISTRIESNKFEMNNSISRVEQQINNNIESKTNDLLNIVKQVLSSAEDNKILIKKQQAFSYILLAAVIFNVIVLFYLLFK